MEDMEQQLETQETTEEVKEVTEEVVTEETPVEVVVEEAPKKKKIKNFWKGAICGALFSLVLCAIVLVATGVFKKEEQQGTNSFIEDFVNSSGLVTPDTQAKLRNIRSIIDEIYLLFQHEYSANFLFTLWKRVRKYGAYCTGITQNVDDLLQSHTARTMLANSEFLIMLNQASTDRLRLAELVNISDMQMSYITNVEAGRGLMKVGSALVPFFNKFPKHTKLYKLMTTKPGEV